MLWSNCSCCPSGPAVCCSSDRYDLLHLCCNWNAGNWRLGKFYILSLDHYFLYFTFWFCYIFSLYYIYYFLKKQTVFMNTTDQLKNSLMLYSSDIWKDRHAGPHTNQQEQQFSDVSAGCAASFQVRECVFLLLTEE